MRDDLLPWVVGRDDLAALDPASRRLLLRELAPDPALAAEIADAIDGYGPITPLMEDDAVTDILINGPGKVWVERAGVLARVEIRFEPRELRRYTDRWLSSSGVSADASRPIGEARLRCGARVHVVLPPAAPDGPLVSIRKFPRVAWSLDDLRRAGMFGPDVQEELEDLVAARRSVVVTGGTGSGKTTMLAALLGRVPEHERIVLIEEVREVRVPGRHLVSLVARPPNVEGRGGVDVETLARAALRMRPDRIVVGEVRGAEALVALRAMATGHEGSMLTLHARSPEEVHDRLVALALGAGSGASESALRAQALEALDAVVHLGRAGGNRCVVAVGRWR